MAAALWRSLARRKPLPTSSRRADSTPSLARVLTTWDLIALGVGSTLGVGIYVLAGDVARRQAGPAVLLSFVVAGIASGLAGLCYAEFGARVPLAGSAYVYSYVSVGELLAFVIGWSLVLEYAIGSASVARALSSYVDQLTGNILARTFEKILPMNVSILASYADPVSFAVAFGLAVILAFGVRESLSLNNIFAGVNMAVILFVVVAGSLKADPKNWNISPRDAPSTAHVGDGSFMPFGISGVLRGAATCFYGFVGFDCIAASGEEVRRPQKAIPVAILGSLFVVCLSYLAVSAVLTLMWPYYDLMNNGAPLAHVFLQVGWPIAQWVVAVGGIFGLITSLFGTMFPLPRVIYAMATDGLIFRCLGEVHSRFQTPFVGTLLSGLLTGIMAALFHLQQLVDMLSIGTLMAYTLVATCVLLLRYRACEDDETCALINEQIPVRTTWGVFKQLFNLRGLKSPTNLTSRMVTVLIILYCILSAVFAVLLVHNERGIISLGSVASVMTLLLIFISLQPSTIKSIPFKVPLVPILPALSISMNIYLMLLLDRPTWIRFSVWMVGGCLLWVVYIACRCCFPETQVKESYDNAGFHDHDEIRQTGEPDYEVTDSAGDFVVLDAKTNGISLKKFEDQNGIILQDNHADTPETATRRVNRFVRPTSVIQGELSMESVTDLAVEGDVQSDDIGKKKGRSHRPTGIQENQLSFDLTAASDSRSVDGDTHSLYPEVFICLSTEEDSKQQAIQEEDDGEGQGKESLEYAKNSSSLETSEAIDFVMNDDWNTSHVPEDETSSQSMMECLDGPNKFPLERKSLSRDGSLLETSETSDDGEQPVTTKPDSDPGMGRSLRNDEELSPTGETVVQERLPESRQSLSETEGEGLVLNESDILETENIGLENEAVIRTGESTSSSLTEESETGDVSIDNETILKDEGVGNAEYLKPKEEIKEIPIPISENVNKSPQAEASVTQSNPPKKSPPQTISKKQHKSSLPNFSISSFDNKPIDTETNLKKPKPPSLKNAMAAGSFSDSSFVERLNDIIGRRSSNGTTLELKREQSVGTPTNEVSDDLDDDVFMSSEDIPSKDVIRERLESFLLNRTPRTSVARFNPVPQPRARKVARESEPRKVEEQNQAETGTGNEVGAGLESSFVEKLDAIMKRRTGSLPPIKKKGKEDSLLGGHTLPERRSSKAGLSSEPEDVPSRDEIRRRLESLFLNDPKRGVTPVEQMSTVL